jgi:Uncharacterized protein conserved in bacteria
MNIYDSALRRLSAQPRTEFELRKYLNDKGFMNSEIDDVISEFLSCGYLDDAAFCADYFRYAFGKGWGRKRIVSELKKKGVDAEVIQNAFADYEEENPVDERTIARQEAEKILRMADISGEEPVPEKVLGRIARRLASYGYSPEIIYGIIGELRK